MSEPRIELVYFNGCPNAGKAREALRAVGDPHGWGEWDLLAEDTPARFRRFGSPTVLVDGRDVTGGTGGNSALACRADGVPSTAVIARALGRRV